MSARGMWLYAHVYGVVSPVMVGRVSPSVCTADEHGMPSWGAVCRVNTDWTAPENVFSVTVLLPLPPIYPDDGGGSSICTNERNAIHVTQCRDNN